MAQTREEINAWQRANYAKNREHRLTQERGYRQRDAEKIKARRKAAYESNPEKYRAKVLKSRHGLTVEAYDAILASQGGGCAVCSATTPGGRAKQFHVDHDHNCCGAIKSCDKCRRGLLCSQCNVGIGMLKDNTTILASAIEYLERATS